MAVNNLFTDTATVSIKGPLLSGASNVNTTRLYFDGETPVLTRGTVPAIPTSTVLGPNEIQLFAVTLSAPCASLAAVNEATSYAAETVVAITGEEQEFLIPVQSPKSTLKCVPARPPRRHVLIVSSPQCRYASVRVSFSLPEAELSTPFTLKVNNATANVDYSIHMAGKRHIVRSLSAFGSPSALTYSSFRIPKPASFSGQSKSHSL